MSPPARLLQGGPAQRAERENLAGLQADVGVVGVGSRTLLALEHLVRAAHQEGSHQDELGHERGDGHG